MLTYCRAVRSGAAGAARAAPLFGAKFVIIARVHSLLSGATPHYRSMAANSLKVTLPSLQKYENATRAHPDNWKWRWKFFFALCAEWSALRTSISLPSGASTLWSDSRPTPGELPTALDKQPETSVIMSRKWPNPEENRSRMWCRNHSKRLWNGTMQKLPPSHKGHGQW